MEPRLNRHNDHILALVGFLVALPAMYFFTGSVLKYELNILANVDILVPPPWVMIGGLLLALILNLYPFIRQLSRRADGAFISYHEIKTVPWNASMCLLASLFLFLLLGYVLVENLMEIGIVKHGQ